MPSPLVTHLRALARQLRAQADAVDAQADAIEQAPTSSPENGAQLVGAGDVGVDRVTWRRAIRSGELRGVLVGREYRAARADVDAWLEARRATIRPLAKAKPREPESDGDEFSRALRR